MTTYAIHEQTLADYQAMPTKVLVEFIVENFHEKHRAQLPELIILARKIEEVHHDHNACPTGLNELLQTVYQELESHMLKEEQILFPMLAGGIFPQGPIAVMEEEHEHHEQLIEQLLALTNQCQPPTDACGSWLTLYTQLADFIFDLHQHIALENTVLFKQPAAAAGHHGNGHCCGGCQ